MKTVTFRAPNGRTYDIRGMHAGALAGVAHRSVSGGDMADGLQRLIKALERHGRITLSVQY
jgi:hypothetical protein